MKNDWRLYLAMAAIGFVLSLALFGHAAKERERVSERVVVRTRIDTVHDVVRVPIARLQVSGKASRRTLMNTKRCAELDTLIAHDTSALFADTLHIAFCEPDDRFDIRMAFSPRRAAVAIPVLLHDTVIERAESLARENSRPWYEEALMILGAAAAGYLMGRTGL